MKISNRRLWTGIVWGIINYATLYLQPVLGLDVEACKLIFVHSSVVAGVIVVGISATDYAGIKDDKV